MRVSFLLFFILFSMVFSFAQNPNIRSVRVKKVANTYLNQDLFVDPILNQYLNDRGGLSVQTGWNTLSVGEGDWYSDRELRGSFVHIVLESPSEQTLLLNPMGVKWFYLNDRPLIGNRYQGKDSFESWEPDFSFVRVPVRLQKGENHMLLRCNRGRFKLAFSQADGAVFIHPRDVTLPDLLIGETPNYWGGAVLINTSGSDLENLSLECSLEGGQTTQTRIRFLAAESLHKPAFLIKGNSSVRQEGATSIELKLLNSAGKVLAQTRFQLKHRAPNEQHKRTYRSKVDGSVQYFAVKPAFEPSKEQALVLSVHGANVEATNQAGSYAAKSWTHIVSPTNRRPYGFNWEDWGRQDALDVLKETKSIYQIDPDRIYLTGHSMGGHGTWVIGSTHPDQFAAIGPSAGYLTIGRYYRSRVSEAQTPEDHPLLERSRNTSLTDSLLTNLRQLGVYVIHGDADRVVPPEQSRKAIEQLASFHHDYYYHEEPEQGHWWDLDDEPGADCVDWAPLFDFYARKSRPGKERIRDIEFTTANPAVSPSYYWATIYRQERYLDFSKIKLRFDPGKNRVSGQTDNVSVFALEPPLNTGKAFFLELDGQSFKIENPKLPVFIAKKKGQWIAISPPGQSEKGPHRYGTFKEVINHQAVLVYGTKGSKEERIWAREKALFDAQTFWYQGNGSLEVIPDKQFDPAQYSNRNVLLYGNATTNRAWKFLLGDSPVQVDKRKIEIGDLLIHGEGKGDPFYSSKSKERPQI